MESIQALPGELTALGWSTGVLLVLGVAIWFVHRWLMGFYSTRHGQQHYRQLLMACIYLFAASLAIILMPFGEATQGQLLGFLLLLTGATVALSGTTVVGNAMAGLMIRSSRYCKPGDYIRVGEHVGWIRNMDLLHVEILAEDRSLTVLPNLFLVTNPLQVLPMKVVDVEVAVSITVPRVEVEEALFTAAETVGLTEAEVNILLFDQSSVRYQVSGQLDRAEQYVAARRKLHAKMLDALQAAGIGGVAPHSQSAPAASMHMPVTPVLQMAAVAEAHQAAEEQDSPAAMAKPVVNEEMQRLKKDYTTMSQQLIEIEQELRDAGPGEKRQPINLKKKKLEAQMLRTEKEIGKLAADLKASQS